MRRFFARWFVDDTPHREAVCAAFDKLPPIPEQDRMRIQRVRLTIRIKPRSFDEWTRIHGRRSA
jgi:hypothetical protein